MSTAGRGHMRESRFLLSRASVQATETWPPARPQIEMGERFVFVQILLTFLIVVGVVVLRAMVGGGR